MSKSLQLVIIVLATCLTVGRCLECDDSTDLATGICARLSRDLQRALLRDEGNIFRIRRAFFHSPTTSSILLKVVYNITYGENLTSLITSEDIPPCSSHILRQSTIKLNQTNITMGWTSSGVYTMFHPTVLSVMQVHSPFAFLKIIHRTLKEQGSPEADSFLWDGSYDLPTLYLNLHITSLMCIPSQELLESLLTYLNSLLKLYAGGEDVLVDIHEKFGFVGFTLPGTSVSSRIIPTGSDVIFMNLYSSILCVIYAVSICSFTVWYYQSKEVKEKIDHLINDNAELFLGIRITSTTALVVEFVSRLSACIVWTFNIDNSLGILFGVWMPQIHLLTMAAVQVVFVSFYVSYQKKKKTGKFDCDSKAEIRTFSNMCATSFGLFYMLFPTIILMFAYPTQIIVIFTFVTAYLFATTIFTASVIKLYNRYKHMNSMIIQQNSSNEQQSGQKTKRSLISLIFAFLLFIILWLTVVYLHFLIVFVSYPLLIGRGAVINTGPIFLISLLPSVILSGGAWTAKRYVFSTIVDDSTAAKSVNEVLQNIVKKAEKESEKQSNGTTHIDGAELY